MDCLLERKVKINRNTKSHFNEWCLNEFDENDKQVGFDFLPFKFNLSFSCVSLQASTSVHINNLTDKKSPQIIANLINQSEAYIDKIILGKFQSGSLSDKGDLINEDQFSIFGTARSINEFNVVIMQTSVESEETCWLTVIPSHKSEGYNFKQTIEKDYAGFEVYLTSNKFNELAKLIEARSIDSATLTMGNVEGVYAKDYPTISNHYEIKFLTNENVIEGLENSKYEGTTIQKVGNFNIKFTSSASFSSKQVFESTEFIKKYQSNFNEDLESINTFKNNTEKNTFELQILLKAINNLKIVLWFVFAALLFLLLK